MHTQLHPSPWVDAWVAVTQVQKAAGADQQSLGWQLQQLGPAMLGKTLWRLWPDGNQWYTADMTHQTVEVGHFGLVPLVVAWPQPQDGLAQHGRTQLL